MLQHHDCYAIVILNFELAKFLKTISFYLSLFIVLWKNNSRKMYSWVQNNNGTTAKQKVLLMSKKNKIQKIEQ